MLYLSLGNPSRTISIQYPQLLHDKIVSSVFTTHLNEQGYRSDISYNIEISDNKYHLYRNNRLTHRNKSVNKIIYALEWQIVNDCINSYKKQSKFHAAALSLQDII